MKRTAFATAAALLLALSSSGCLCWAPQRHTTPPGSHVTDHHHKTPDERDPNDSSHREGGSESKSTGHTTGTQTHQTSSSKPSHTKKDAKVKDEKKTSADQKKVDKKDPK